MKQKSRVAGFEVRVAGYGLGIAGRESRDSGDALRGCWEAGRLTDGR